MQFNDDASLVTHNCTGEASTYDFENIIPTYSVLDSGLSPETVCNADDRIRVIDTKRLPFKAICKLYLKAENGANLIGTGWLTHANKLYTAGHCVHDDRYGGWMDSIIVVPAMSGLSEPYGRYEAVEIATTKGWINKKSERYDMGAIKLASDVSHSDFLEPTLSDADIVTVCGYPSDRDKGIFQYKMRDTVRKADGRFFYQIDTHGGQSGAPLLRNSCLAIGIHNYGGCDNSGSDLYESFIEFVDSW